MTLKRKGDSYLMVVRFIAKLDGSRTVIPFHVPIVAYYLRSARGYALSSSETEEYEERLLSCISAIVFSGMAIEAFINERAEAILSEVEREDFDNCRRGFHKPKGISRVAFKYGVLVLREFGIELKKEIGEGIAKLIELRNILVHYKLDETAGNYLMPGPKTEVTPEGGLSISWSLTGEPIGVEPPFIQRVNPNSAIESYNAALSAIRYWLQLCGAEDELVGYEEIQVKGSA